MRFNMSDLWTTESLQSAIGNEFEFARHSTSAATTEAKKISTKHKKCLELNVYHQIITI